MQSSLSPVRSLPRIPDGLGGGAALRRPPWLGLHKPAREQVRLRLLILPFAGGNASAFFPWIREMDGDDWLEIAVLQPPGRGARHREAPLNNLSDYARAVADLIADLEHDYGAAPVVLMGYSMGALVSYLSVRDFGQSMPVRHVIAAARKAPRPPHPGHVQEHRRAMSRDAVLARLRSLQGTPEAVLRNPDLIEPYLDSISAEFHLVDSFADAHLPPLPVPVTAIAGLDDPETPLDQVFLWQDLTRKSFAAHFLEGGHFFMNTARPALQCLVRQVLVQTLEGDSQ